MIVVCKPYLEKKKDKTRCNCDIIFNNEKKNLWFEVDNKYSEYLCTERGDAYLIGLLHYAMQHNEDIELKVPVTEELLYNIEKIFIPSISNYAKSLHKISINAKVEKPLMMGKHVGTGCSCGIDSFSAIYNHSNTKYSNLDITHVCINSVGAYNECYRNYSVDKIKNERFEKTREVAKYLCKELVETDSNYQEIIPENHCETHTYSSVFAIYMLQKFWKVYYYASSGLDYSYFNIVNNDKHDCSHYELLSLQCFSIPGLKIYSEGGEKSRLEKTKEIVDFMPARKYLYVCLTQPINCNICGKCKRTLLTLDILGKLNNFKDVFNIEYYKHNKKKYYIWLYEQHLKKDAMNEPTYKLFKLKKEFRHTILINILYILIKVYLITPIKMVIPNDLKRKIKNFKK